MKAWSSVINPKIPLYTRYFISKDTPLYQQEIQFHHKKSQLHHKTSPVQVLVLAQLTLTNPRSTPQNTHPSLAYLQTPPTSHILHSPTRSPRPALHRSQQLLHPLPPSLGVMHDHQNHQHLRSRPLDLEHTSETLTRYLMSVEWWRGVKLARWTVDGLGRALELHRADVTSHWKPPEDSPQQLVGSLNDVHGYSIVDRLGTTAAGQGRAAQLP